MANTFLTPTIIAKEAIGILMNNTIMSNFCTTDYQQEFTGTEKVGESVNVRIPPSYSINKYLATDTTVTDQDITETNRSIMITDHFDASVKVSARDWTLSFDRFSSAVIKPIMVAFAEQLDNSLINLYKEIPYSATTLGTVLTTHAHLAALNKKASDEKWPNQGRKTLINTAQEASVLGAQVLAAADTRGKTSLIDRAEIGTFYNMDWFTDQNLGTHTKGTAEATLSINGAVAAGVSTMILANAGNAKTLLRGDLFTVANATSGYQGTILGTWNSSTEIYDDYTATGGGAIAGPVNFYPAAPASGFGNTEVVTVNNSHALNLAFVDQSAFAFVAPPLALPKTANVDSGYASFGSWNLRVVSSYNRQKKSDELSFDMLFGGKAIFPELAFRF